MEAASAIWLDWDNHYSRVTQNIVYDVSMCCNGALFIEASIVPNMIDNNNLWNIHGIPIYTGDSDILIIAHNLIGPSTNAGVYSISPTGRNLHGRPLTSCHNRIVNNIFFTKDPIFFKDPDNFSNNNVFPL